MVYTERTDKCISPKDNNNNNNSSNVNKSGSATTKKVHPSSASSSSTSWSKTASNDEKWKYNQMVRDNRDKFNNLHFC